MPISLARAALLLIIPCGALSAQQTLESELAPRPLVGSSQRLTLLYQRWKAAMGSSLRESPLLLRLGWSRGRSARFTRAQGEVVLDLTRSTLAITVSRVEDEDLEGAGELDAWLGLYSPDATTQPARWLGRLQATDGAGSLVVPIDSELARLEAEEIWLTRPGQGPDGGRLLFAAPDLFQRMSALELTRARPLLGREIGGIPLRAPPPIGVRGSETTWHVRGLDELVAKGERLFFEETFGGNLRTCGSCHPAENNFTLDPEFIATLPADDPLFVAEREPALDSSRNGGLVFESPEHMRRFGLIVENPDGFDDLAGRFVLRGVQSTLALATTIEPSPFFNQPLRHLTGWAGDGSPGRGSLREFALGAVRQHFPRTLARREGVDFRLPDSGELSALEGFQLSLGRSEDPDLAASFTSPSVRRGVQAFFFKGLCNACHANAGGNSTFLGSHSAVFLDTGVEKLIGHSPDGVAAPHPVDGGFGTRLDGGFGSIEPSLDGGYGSGRFNVPSLVELADTLPAFHGNVTAIPSAGLENSVEGAIRFYTTQEFHDSEVGGGVFDFELEEQDIADLGRLLRALNALENLRTVDEYVARALEEALARPRIDTEKRVQRLLHLAELENEDALQVLEAVDLHPNVQLLLQEGAHHLERAREARRPERLDELRRLRKLLDRARGLIVG